MNKPSLNYIVIGNKEILMNYRPCQKEREVSSKELPLAKLK
jgi:hypothetical protein